MRAQKATPHFSMNHASESSAVAQSATAARCTDGAARRNSATRGKPKKAASQGVSLQ
jgi:hypothetical protein